MNPFFAIKTIENLQSNESDMILAERVRIIHTTHRDARALRNLLSAAVRFERDAVFSLSRGCLRSFTAKADAVRLQNIKEGCPCEMKFQKPENKEDGMPSFPNSCFLA
jgi:hypothetical protein